MNFVGTSVVFLGSYESVVVHSEGLKMCRAASVIIRRKDMCIPVYRDLYFLHLTRPKL